MLGRRRATRCEPAASLTCPHPEILAVQECGAAPPHWLHHRVPGHVSAHPHLAQKGRLDLGREIAAKASDHVCCRIRRAVVHHHYLSGDLPWHESRCATDSTTGPSAPATLPVVLPGPRRAHDPGSRSLVAPAIARNGSLDLSSAGDSDRRREQALESRSRHAVRGNHKRGPAESLLGGASLSPRVPR